MESQPQNPELRNNPENTPMYITRKCYNNHRPTQDNMREIETQNRDNHIIRQQEHD